jgi:hypothetical protein
MAVEAIATQAAPPPRVTELGPAVQQQPPGPGEAGRFAAALDQAAQAQAQGDVPPAVRNLLETLDRVDGQARSVAEYARSAEASSGELTPGEIVQLTMRCQEFMVHCQLTSNIANRSSDGIQQLFRQQG